MAENNLLTTKEAADLLRVSPRTVVNWIDNDAIPYVELPSSGASSRREFRIPLHGLLTSLSGSYDMSEQLKGETGATLPPARTLLK